MHRLWLTACWILASLLTAAAHADDAQTTPDPKPPTPAEPEPEPEPQSALGWWWQHSTPVPIIFYTPENQLGGGAGVMTTWQMPRALADRPSNAVVYGVYTMRKQTIFGASYELRFAEDRYVFSQELRFIDWPDRFYGIGNNSRDSAREDFVDHYWQLETETLYRPWRQLYGGLRHQLRVSQAQDIEPDGVLNTEKPTGVGRVLWSGVGPVLIWDSRKGLFWPEGGSLLRMDATFFRPALGADFSAELVRMDLRHYQPLWWSHVLALRFVMFGGTGELPFQLYPSLGGASLFRGWFLGRLRDRVLVAAEAEYRIPITRLWSVVGFGSVGRVASRLSGLALGGMRATGGAGVRFAVRPESRANFRLDMAYGDQFYVYFQFREAF